jgi:hypothetical protein
MDAYTQGGTAHMRIKLTLVTLVATLLMAFATSSPSARNISISHGGLFTAEWRPLRFVSDGLVAAECDVTFEGSFHYRTFLKVTNSLVGYITRAISNACRSGSATVLTANLPWHITYQSFEGALPNITGVRIALILAEYRLHERIFGTTECLSRTSVGQPWILVARLGAGSESRLVTGLTSNTVNTIGCGFIEFAFEGTARVREVPGASENLLVRLI